MPPKLSDVSYQNSAGQPTDATSVTLSAEQFDKLVELLTPGCELAKSYLAQQQQALPDPGPTEPIIDAPPSDPTN